ncbi:hypothetical protein ACPUER_25540 [Burkholderia sp. DN3021]|uniref:hypothetical protein n=1 Tax=Burkholderia sp. DN3021 TaxID=3410137 RepID=UPI002856C012|nr:hypothetical protein [Burkholderia ambifaria]MDR6500623.1 hypothetical protein [Burkholderia ambifaria]
MSHWAPLFPKFGSMDMCAAVPVHPAIGDAVHAPAPRCHGKTRDISMNTDTNTHRCKAPSISYSFATGASTPQVNSYRGALFALRRQLSRNKKISDSIVLRRILTKAFLQQKQDTGKTSGTRQRSVESGLSMMSVSHHPAILLLISLRLLIFE